MKRFFIINALALISLAGSASPAQKSGEVEPFDRGLGGTLTGTFVPKGTIGAGINFSYNTVELGSGFDDMGYSMLFGLVGGLKGSMYTFGVTPQVSYFVADNLSIGLRFVYKRAFRGVNNVSL